MMSERSPACKDLAERARKSYREQFGSDPGILARAPGRLELLGNHTDYNNGYILSVALELAVVLAAGKDETSPSRLAGWSSELNERIDACLEKPAPLAGAWINYPLGVLREIMEGGIRLPSINLAVESSLPSGAGASSSAALELATAEAVYGLLGGRPEEPMEIAKLCRRAENDFVGVPCGIMDQFSALFGKRDHVLFLDCKTLTYERLPLR
ncbi:MAG: galactokinase family protein, partial [Planctomycetota bacterium]|nr:galactokinase family protein [Planctomycetota bacterium]